MEGCRITEPEILDLQDTLKNHLVQPPAFRQGKTSAFPFVWGELESGKGNWLSDLPKVTQLVPEVASCPCLLVQCWQRRVQLIHRRVVNICSFIRKQPPSGQMARVIKLILFFFQTALFRMKNGAVQLKSLSKKHEMHTGWATVKDRLVRGPQEASWTSNQIIIVISISRQDSTNNNIYKVTSILSNCHFPRASWWERVQPSQGRCTCF